MAGTFRTGFTGRSKHVLFRRISNGAFSDTLQRRAQVQGAAPGSHQNSLQTAEGMVRGLGLEPRTSALKGRCSTN